MSKKTGNFKPLVLVQFQPAVDSGITVDIGDAIKREIEGPVVEEPPAPEPGEILAALAVDGPEEVRRLWMFVRPVANELAERRVASSAGFTCSARLRQMAFAGGVPLPPDAMLIFPGLALA